MLIYIQDFFAGVDQACTLTGTTRVVCVSTAAESTSVCVCGVLFACLHAVLQAVSHWQHLQGCSTFLPWYFGVRCIVWIFVCTPTAVLFLRAVCVLGLVPCCSHVHVAQSHVYVSCFSTRPYNVVLISPDRLALPANCVLQPAS